MFAIEKVPVWGECQDSLVEGFEDVTDLKVERVLISENFGGSIIFQIDDDNSIPRSLMLLLMTMEICYKTHLYEIDGLKILSISDSTIVSGAARMLIMFKHKTRCM